MCELTWGPVSLQLLMTEGSGFLGGSLLGSAGRRDHVLAETPPLPLALAGELMDAPTRPH